MSMLFELLLKKLMVPDPECPNTQDCLEIACSECGEKYCITHKDVEGIYCPDCGKRVCGNCVVMCEDCNSIYCPNCVQVCEGCGWTICKMICVDNHQHNEEPECPVEGCEFWTCGSCGEKYCEQHGPESRTCDCGVITCPDCQNWCDNCKRWYCNDCGTVCAKCGKLCCSECTHDCEDPSKSYNGEILCEYYHYDGIDGTGRLVVYEDGSWQSARNNHANELPEEGDTYRITNDSEDTPYGIYEYTMIYDENEDYYYIRLGEFRYAIGDNPYEQ